MPHLIWTGTASARLREIYHFLAKDDAEVAAKAINAIRNRANLLKQYPHAGRPADDLEPEHRELLVPFGATGYVLYYEVQDNTVYLLAVRHQKEAGY